MSSELEEWLRSAGRQRRLRAARRGLGSGLWACTAVCVAQTLARLNGLDLLHWMAPLALLGGVLGPLLALWRLPRGAMADALWVDRRLAGQSAFSTWLEGRDGSVQRDAAAQRRLQAWCLARLPHSREALRTLPSPAWPRTALAAATLALLLALLVETLPGWQAGEPRWAALPDSPAATAQAPAHEPDATGFGAAVNRAVDSERSSAGGASGGEAAGAEANPSRNEPDQDTADSGAGAGMPASGAVGAGVPTRPPEAQAAGQGGGKGQGVGDGVADGLATGPTPSGPVALLQGATRTGAAGSVAGAGGPYDAAPSTRAAPGRAGRPMVAAARPPRAQATLQQGGAETRYLNAWKQASRS